jgi:hypothetical protein
MAIQIAQPQGDGLAVSEVERYARLSNLVAGPRSGTQEDLRTTPLFSLKVKDAVEGVYEGSSDVKIFSQYAVLGFHNGVHPLIEPDEPILMNVDAPNSAFICGSQGSGKSYTLNCMLENCLTIDERIGSVRAPLAGLAFHFDRDAAGGVAETAHLCSMGVPVNVLVSRSNEYVLRKAYGRIPGAKDNLEVRPLLFQPKDLSIGRMKQLMAFSGEGKEGQPLYMATVEKILRQMAIASNGQGFDYFAFKKSLSVADFTREQRGPLGLRLELLESYLDLSGRKGDKTKDSIWEIQAGTLTIVDLTDPFVDPATACILFNICLGLAEEQRTSGGLVVALDEAHRYLTTSLTSSTFTAKLLDTIRMQRHNATRVIIATQEPTVSPTLLDLCSVSIIHRFTSPSWFTALRGHLSAASEACSSHWHGRDMFQHIVDLSVGESLVFASSAFLGVGADSGPCKLGRMALCMKTRTRLSNDGGMSVLTSDPIQRTSESLYHAQAPSQIVKVESTKDDNPDALNTIEQSNSKVPTPNLASSPVRGRAEAIPGRGAEKDIGQPIRSKDAKSDVVHVSKIQPASPSVQASSISKTQSRVQGSSASAAVAGQSGPNSTTMKSNGKAIGVMPNKAGPVDDRARLGLKRDRHHIVLICCRCDRAALIECNTPAMPNVTTVKQAERTIASMGYITCASCRPTELRSAGTADKPRRKYELDIFQDFTDGRIAVDTDVRENLLRVFRQVLGHELRLLVQNGKPLYLLSYVVEQKTFLCSIFRIDGVTKKGKSAADVVTLTRHVKGDMF